MLQNLVGNSQEIFTNQPISESNDTESTQSVLEKEETSESTEDLFAELFSEEELKNMNQAEVKKDEGEEEIKPKEKKYNIELY